MNDYYEKNHKDYFSKTIDVDPSTFLKPLADVLEPGAEILDIGCGGGRDMAWFVKQGFRPTGFERSPSLAKLARDHSGRQVIEGDFRKYDFSTLNVDALVLIGTLVHLKKTELPSTLASICWALSPGGLLLLTLKEGIGSKQVSDGRLFTLWSVEELGLVFKTCKLEILDFKRQVSKLGSDDIWLGYLLRIAGDGYVC